MEERPSRSPSLLIPALLALILCLAAMLFAQEVPADPRQGEVPLPASAGWKASLVYEGDAGIWTVESLPLFPHLGCPEVVALDDRGRCLFLVSYSGRWTPRPALEDGEWLGGLALADLDPGLPGPELYTGGRGGRLYQVHPRSSGASEVAAAWVFPGLEIHTLVAGDLRRSRPGQEMLAFLHDGQVFLILPRAEGARGVEARRLATLSGRVRQAVVLPPEGEEDPWVATVSRAGEVMLLRLDGAALEQRLLLNEPMGLGRLALRSQKPTARPVLYASRDDGLILRLEEGDDGAWSREVVFAGPQGPRGVAAGPFDLDPERETVAVFGYSGKVQLLTRTETGRWGVSTIFEDRDKGHWLAAAELDGRNGTRELLGSGYGRRVFLLSRPPGYGLGPVATSPEPKPEGKEEAPPPASSPPPP